MKRVSLAVGLAIDFASVALFAVGRVSTVCDGVERLPTVPVRVRRLSLIARLPIADLPSGTTSGRTMFAT